MPSRTEELTIVFRREKFRQDNFVIALGDIVSTGPVGANVCPAELIERGPQSVSIKGEAEPEEFQAGLTYRLYGRKSHHPQYGPQFDFTTFVRATPHGRAGVVRYLQKAPGIGEATARKLWEKFQSDAVRILRESPDVAVAAVDLGHFTEEKSKQAAEFLRGEARLEACTIDLIDLLGGRGFPKTTIKKAIQVWGNRAVEVLKRSPYLLMRFRGCGFVRADSMYISLGGNPNAMKRQALCAWHVLAKDSEGDTWKTAEFVNAGLRSKIAGTEIRPEAAMLLGTRGRLIAQRRDELGRLWLAEHKRAAAELRVAQFVAEAIAEDKDNIASGWPIDLDDLNSLSDHQATLLGAATGGNIGILGGSPGTGKTYCAAALISMIVKAHGHASIAVCAPTGKAAVRVTESLAAYGISLRAKTIHSLLRVAQRDEGEGWGFEHNERFPLPQRFIVVDESSMIDTGLLASLLAARAKGCHILFVGDINQLPPVGHGAPLRDMIAAGLSYGELKEIRRNAGTIVRACAQIRDGQKFSTDAKIDLAAEPPQNLRVIEATEPQSQIHQILRCLEAAKASQKHPVWDCQVIVPVNAKSQLSRKELNKLLQRELNKTGQRAGSNPFFVGDKIVCLKNSFVPGDAERNECRGVETDSDGKVFVANGELAEVLEVSNKLTHARLLSPERFVKIPRGAGNGDEEDDDDRHGRHGEDAAKETANTGCQWDLAYALSCHKAQGSEFPIVIVMLDEYAGARMVCSREWLYTAISRAKSLCLLVGKKSTADGFCTRIALTKRKTFLKELIAEKLIELRAGEVVGRAESASSVEELCESLL